MEEDVCNCDSCVNSLTLDSNNARVVYYIDVGKLLLNIESYKGGLESSNASPGQRARLHAIDDVLMLINFQQRYTIANPSDARPIAAYCNGRVWR